MEIILKEDIIGLGYKNDIVNVKSGYGRNYLMPRKLAAPGTSENINNAKQKQAAAKHKASVATDEARILASQLKKVELTIPVKVGEGGKTFGTISSKEIAKAAMDQHQMEIDKKKIQVAVPIKSLGVYETTVKLHPKVNAVLRVKVEEEK